MNFAAVGGSDTKLGDTVFQVYPKKDKLQDWGVAFQNVNRRITLHHMAKQRQIKIFKWLDKHMLWL